MSNNFTQNPIYIDTDTTVVGSTNWRGSSGGAQLNPGNLPSNAQQLSGAVSRQWGIRPTMVIVQQASGSVATVAGNVVVSDPNTVGGQLLIIPIVSTTQTPIIIEEFSGELWRDFIVTGVTATKTSLQIFYRQ